MGHNSDPSPPFTRWSDDWLDMDSINIDGGDAVRPPSGEVGENGGKHSDQQSMKDVLYTVGSLQDPSARQQPSYLEQHLNRPVAVTSSPPTHAYRPPAAQSRQLVEEEDIFAHNESPRPQAEGRYDPRPESPDVVYTRPNLAHVLHQTRLSGGQQPKKLTSRSDPHTITSAANSQQVASVLTTQPTNPSKPGRHAKGRGPDDESLRQREALLQEQAAVLEKELQTYQQHNTHLRQLRKQQEHIVSELQGQKSDLAKWCQEERARVEAACEEMKAAAQRERR